MAYTCTNYKTKKALKEAVVEWLKWNDNSGLYELNLLNKDEHRGNIPNPVRCFQPGLGPPLDHFTGTVYLEGPHYPKPHTWYAQAVLKDGVVVIIK
jgi:hypothetical protein